MRVLCFQAKLVIDFAPHSHVSGSCPKNLSNIITNKQPHWLVKATIKNRHDIQRAILLLADPLDHRSLLSFLSLWLNHGILQHL